MNDLVYCEKVAHGCKSLYLLYMFGISSCCASGTNRVDQSFLFISPPLRKLTDVVLGGVNPLKGLGTKLSQI